MFDKLFALVGPTWSALALLALVLAYFAVAASETVRVAHAGDQTPPAWWLKVKAWIGRVRHRSNKKPPMGPTLPSSPYN
ncbi:MAG: hypothetical protein H6718_28400 [Polyangiaceae bacterium]|nr:hypothetical protein [Myxococcales bacterium]MCB9589368.1 hypothetical protein [Polyangiaceae bacterium]